MGKKVILFGAKEYEKRLKYYIDFQTDDKVVAFCVDREYMEYEYFDGCPVVAVDEMIAKYPAEQFQILVGFGYKNMNDLRRQKSMMVKKMGYTLYNLVNRQAYVDETVILGEGNIILGNVYIDYYSKLGDGNVIEIGTQIPHECQIGNYNYFAPDVVLGGKVKIGDNTFIGINATIRSAVEIQSYALIGAGTYVDRDVDEQAVIVPARSKKIEKKSRDMNIMYKGENRWNES